MTIGVTAHARPRQTADAVLPRPNDRLERRRARQRGRVPAPAPHQSTLSPSTASRWASLPTSLHPLMAHVRMPAHSARQPEPWLVT